MKSLRRRLRTAALLISALLSGVYLQAHNNNSYGTGSRHILIVSSYSNGYNWSDEIIDYIGGELTTRHDHYDVSVEHLSGEYNPDPNVWIYRYNIITSSYKEYPPDLLVLIGDEAWHAYRYSLKRETFKNVKVIVIAAKSITFTKEQLEQPDSLSFSDIQKTEPILKEMNATGVLRDLNLSGLFEVIEDMIHPLKRIYILTDYRIQGFYSRLLAKKVLEERGHPEGVFIKSQDMPTDSLLRSIPHFSDSSAIFISSWFTTGFGFRYSLNYVYSRISKNTKLPIFGIVGKAVENGHFTGGYFMPQTFWGERAVKMIEEVEKRGSVREVPVETYTDSLFHINWDNAKERNITRRNIPKGAKIYGRPLDYVIKYKKEFTIVGIIFLIIIVSSVFVFRSYLLVRAARIRLMDSEDNLFKALRKSQESDRLKSAFLANMSHEIRTPMNSILGFISILEEDNITTNERREYLGIMRSSGERLMGTINDVIDISKIESGQMKVTLSEFNVNDLIYYIYNMFYREAEIRGLKFEKPMLISPEKAIIITDKEKLYSITTNLVKNALKFTPDGFVEFDLNLDNNNLNFYVKDSGVGISNEKIDKVFDRFSYTNDKDKTKVESSGLGLSITKAYCELLEGKVWCESKENEGSIFYVELPLKKKKNKFVS